ncbi:Hypothetical_protein [Hexamita inflata]|uniref:Hypothetical_protein n=1 Tax=Hexamita inflata TaxID=28002 RepID=A0ABP1GJ89_9EUKA
MNLQHITLRLLKTYCESKGGNIRPRFSTYSLQMLTDFFESLFYVTPKQISAPNYSNPQIGFPELKRHKLQPSTEIEEINFERFIKNALQNQDFINSNLIPSEFLTHQALKQQEENVEILEEVQNDFQLGKLMFQFEFEGNLNQQEEIQICKTTVCAPFQSYYGQAGFGDFALDCAIRNK